MALQIPKLVADVLRVAAPTLLAGLTGPFGPIAAAVATAALDAWLPVPQRVEAAANGEGVAPATVVETVQTNANDPKFLLDLRKAEIDLQKYEDDLGFKFAELTVRDRDSARGMARDTGLARPQFIAGMAIVTLSMVMLFGIVVGAVLCLNGTIKVDPANASITVAAFGLLGTVTGVFQAVSAQVLAFYFGSSASSATKTDQIGDTMRDLGQALGDAAKASPPRPAPPVAVPPVLPGPGGDPQPVPVAPATPAPSGLVAELLPALMAPHRHFPDGVSWVLTPQGIAVDGAAAQGTPGEPLTVRAIWKRYGDLCQAAARQYGVPVELVVATICAESKGDATAYRSEPAIGDASTGLMQTLRRTAQSALGRPTLTDDDLRDPATSLAAGTAYIAQQRATTHFDPPLVAAAYNAGSLRRDEGEANRWKLLCYPAGTGRHIDGWTAWFNDAMRVSAEQGWGRAEGVPSFASCIGQTLA